ncbi:uncharacterized protein LOC129573306, partial [Sitodiplosis mosellana]|uniref:uncharacterized protein LOC129573306 n=1 Tax=Sitodiplosis mosellana TaxID=263140 RepID=UPI0024446AE4
MMPNGDLSRCKGSTLIENTTAFDLFVCIIMCQMLDINDTKLKVNNIADPDFVQFIENYIKLGVTPKVIQDRNIILSKFFSKGIVSKVKVMNCESTVWEMATKAWTTLFKAQCLCQNFLDIDLDGTLFELPQCNKNHELQNIIFVDAKGEDRLHQRVADVILINDQIFVLNAVVLQSKYRNKVHFFTDIKRGNFVWYRFDNNTHIISKSKLNEKKRLIHMLIYVHAVKAETEVHTEEQNDKPFSIIENFHTCNYNGTRVMVKNACGPDSLLNIFCRVYVTSPNIFRNMESSDLLMELAAAYKNNNRQRVYEFRIKLLMQSGFKCSHVGTNEVHLNAESNVLSSLRMIFTENFYSILRVRSCKCGKRQSKLTSIQ